MLSAGGGAEEVARMRVWSASEILQTEICCFRLNTVVFDVGKILPQAINSIKFQGKTKNRFWW